MPTVFSPPCVAPLPATSQLGNVQWGKSPHTSLTQGDKHIHRRRAHLEIRHFRNIVEDLEAVAEIPLNTIDVGKVDALPHFQGVLCRFEDIGIYQHVAGLNCKVLNLEVLGHGASAVAHKIGDQALDVSFRVTTEQACGWVEALGNFVGSDDSVLLGDCDDLAAAGSGGPVEVTDCGEIFVDLVVGAFRGWDCSFAGCWSGGGWGGEGCTGVKGENREEESVEVCC